MLGTSGNLIHYYGYTPSALIAYSLGMLCAWLENKMYLEVLGLESGKKCLI